MWSIFRRFGFGFALLGGCVAGQAYAASACVWKVNGPDGGTLYLGGSFHALRPGDYPLPAAYSRAFDASSRLVFEDDPKDSSAAFKQLLRAGQYAKGDSLKNHVDPRTYDYLRRFFALRDVPEEKFRLYRPWLINIMLQAPPPEYYQLGVERFLYQQAKKKSKPVSGLESAAEHNEVFAGLNDRESEALLLIFFISAAGSGPSGGDLIATWRRGDAETLARVIQESFRDFPAFTDRLINVRNRRWLPKLESYLHTGQTYFVVAGAAHMGGPRGVVALLRGRGYKVEQL